MPAALATTYTPSRHGPSWQDRTLELRRGWIQLTAAAELARGRHLRQAGRVLASAARSVTALSPRGPRYVQQDGTRTWGSRGRPVSPRLQDRIDRRMARICANS